MIILDTNPIDMEFIRNKITQLRIHSNISERKLSILLGYNPSYLKEISAGRSNPSLEALLNICDYFNISILEFFDDELTNPVMAKEIYTELKRLCNNDMETLVTILKIIKPSHFNSFIDFMEQYKNAITSK